LRGLFFYPGAFFLALPPKKNPPFSKKWGPRIRGLRVKINAKLPDALRLPVSTSSLQYIEFACFCRPNKAFMPYPA
ncbi:hypothetical protein, partial [Escherichia coli]|uniref:hypothetical protein n=1 Tax=Escherichia coli TaxID=562 RepID=UPI002300AC14